MKISLFGLAILSVVAVLGLSGCQKKSISASILPSSNRVQAGDPKTNQLIGDSKHQFRILGRSAFQERIRLGAVTLGDEPRVDTPNTEPSLNPSLLVGIPLPMLGEQYIFGGVITGVSDRESARLGGLKLTDLPPLHVKLSYSAASKELALVGCSENCSETSNRISLFTLKVAGFDTQNGELILDLSELGTRLNLMGMLDPDGEALHLISVASETLLFDYSLSTLVFDVQTHMIPLKTEENKPAPGTDITVRWYLKLASSFNPAFVSRSQTPGVGFFTTERAADNKITRFPSTNPYNAVDTVAAPVKYYLKHIPEEYQPHFKASFDEWNQNLNPIFGHDLLEYEFVPETDPRNEFLVTGDIRFNIIEWDLVNKAGYGGLGPSMANQFSGETMSANILIQGPQIVSMYKKWFKVSAEAQALKALGQITEAEELVLAFHKEAQALTRESQTQLITLNLGKHLDFRINSQNPGLHDPLMQQDDFDDLPEGYTYDAYMAGYFRDMVEHEMGHNLGLRHNFRGNLGAADHKEQGKVSRSVMEYLNRDFRYLDGIGPYDAMAIRYGYTGARPEITTEFCTDEDAASADEQAASAECSRDDGTNDPFSYYESRLKKGIDRLIARSEKSAPVWTIEDMSGQMNVAVFGIASYAWSAEQTSLGWTNFFGKPGRPADASSVKAYVLDRLKTQLCDPTLQAEALAKETDEARAKVLSNLEDLRKMITEILSPLKIYSSDDLQCLVTGF